MPRPPAFLRIALIKLFALACGVGLGSGLAMAVFNPDPAFFWRSIVSVPNYWFDFGGRTLGFIAGAEWVISLMMAFYTGIVASIVWGLLAWRKLCSAKSAALLGFPLGCIAMVIQSWDWTSDMPPRLIFVLVFGLIGSLCGLAIYAIDHRLQRR